MAVSFEKDEERKEETLGTTKAYIGDIEIVELQNKREFKTFVLIFAFTAGFALLLIVFLKKLKALTHGAEEEEGRTAHEETEGFEVADPEEDADETGRPKF